MSKNNITNEVELLRFFKDNGVSFGNELIVLKEFCRNFISACKLARICVVGVEGFYLLPDGSVKANMSEVADFSDIENDNIDECVEASAYAADKFIERMLVSGKSDGYCFILKDQLH